MRLNQWQRVAEYAEDVADISALKLVFGIITALDMVVVIEETPDYKSFEIIKRSELEN